MVELDPTDIGSTIALLVRHSIILPGPEILFYTSSFSKSRAVVVLGSLFATFYIHFTVYSKI